MKKLLLVMVSILVLTCSCVYLPASPTTTTPAEKPVVSSFSANPSSIASGGTSTLSWSVTGATSVSLDNGIGNVAVSGTRAVAPTASTIYILTASNASGSNNATTQVLVSGTSSTPPAATGIPAVTSFS
ncbi:MAG: hypothetical protein NTZ34_04610, partial [Chloroflexi bacterium]|nr:hypothetical protein [Chloroflexota bacterium]